MNVVLLSCDEWSNIQVQNLLTINNKKGIDN